MKIKPEHLAHMEAAFKKWDTPYHRERYAAAGLSTTRYQWDLIRAAGLMPWLCDTLYTYLNDNHIQTALNRLVKPLEGADSMKQRPPITLSTGRIVLHRPYLSNGEPNGATEAYLQDGSEMTDGEWAEYCSILNKIPLTTVGETA